MNKHCSFFNKAHLNLHKEAAILDHHLSAQSFVIFTLSSQLV